MKLPSLSPRIIAREIASFQRTGGTIWTSPGSGEILLLALLILAGALLRAAYLDALLGWPWVRELLLVGDGLAYQRAALEILAGNPWGVSVSFQDPLYPLFLAFAIKITGSDLAGPLIIQSALGLVTALLAWAIGRRMAGPVAGMAAGALAALSPVVIFYEGLIEKSPLCMLLFAATAWLLGTGLAGGRRGRLVAAGATLIAAALLRGNILLLVPVVLVVPLLAGSARVKSATAVLLLLSGMGLVVGPTVLRNHVVFGNAALTAGQAGPNFYIGNNPDNQTGTFAKRPWLQDDPRFEERDWTTEAERRAGRQLTSGESSDFWFKEGLRYWRDQPLPATRNVIRKSLLYLAEFEQPDTHPYLFFRKRFPPLSLPLPGMGPVIVLAVLGVVLSLATWRNRAAELALFFGYAASVVVFFVLGRYRIVALPLFAAFAGVAVAELARMARQRAVPALAAAAFVLVLALLVVKRGDYPETYDWPLFNVALGLLDEGRYEEAEVQVAKGLRAHPDSALGLELRATLAMKRGDLAEASRALEGALAYAPDRMSLKLALVRLREKEGRAAEAEALLEGLLREDPLNPVLVRALKVLRAGNSGTPFP